jgi:hypothetical protein
MNAQRSFFFNADDTSGAVYLWDFGDGNSDFGAAVSHSYFADGTYPVKLTVYSSEGCQASFDSSVEAKKTINGITLSTPLNDAVSIYPNPSNGNFTIAYSLSSPDKIRISIASLEGKEITVLKECTQQTGNYSLSFDASGASPKAGVYLLRISINGQVFNKKLVINP